MEVIAVILDPAEIRKIIACLANEVVEGVREPAHGAQQRREENLFELARGDHAGDVAVRAEVDRGRPHTRGAQPALHAGHFW
jgi:hypothetical protein